MLDWLPENASTFGDDIDALFAIIYYFTTGILSLVLLSLVTFLILYQQRQKTAQKEHYQAEP